MNQLRAWILQRLDRGEAVVLAAVTQASGSTARGTDALLAMDARGAMVGTVGGGYSEHMTIEAARELFEHKTEADGAPGLARDIDFNLSPESNNTDMVCGGRLSVHLEKIEPGGSAAAVLRACFERVERGKACAFVALHTPEGQRLFALADEEKLSFFEESAQAESMETIHTPWPLPGAPVLKGALAPVLKDALAAALEDALSAALEVKHPAFGEAAEFTLEPENNTAMKGTRVFWLGFAPAPVVYIFGAGHVGKATCELASLVGFRVVVTDDRPALLTVERFPHVSLLRLIESFEHPLAPCGKTPAIEIGPQDCALILTRMHDIDRMMLSHILRTDAGYIGLIGSKTKRDGIYASLRAEGFSDADLARVHAPIGLAIGARTPEEIAVSIMAEIIAVRAGVSTGKPYARI